MQVSRAIKSWCRVTTSISFCLSPQPATIVLHLKSRFHANDSFMYMQSLFSRILVYFFFFYYTDQFITFYKLWSSTSISTPIEGKNINESNAFQCKHYVQIIVAGNPGCEYFLGPEITQSNHQGQGASPFWRKFTEPPIGNWLSIPMSVHSYFNTQMINICQHNQSIGLFINKSQM